jgi:Domain of unknown function (DUF4129)
MRPPGWDQAAREQVAEDRQPGRREPPGRGSANRERRGLLAAGVAVALLALVAVGSLRGPLGSGRGRPSYPADLIDSLLLLLLLAMVAAAVLAVVSLWQDRHQVQQRRRRSGSFALILPMAAVLVLWLVQDVLGLGGGDRDQTPTSTPPAPSTVEVPAPPSDSGVVPWVVAGVALIAMVGIVVAQLVAERRRRRPPRSPAERLVELFDDTLEDLEREPDPRRAVIAAWARMERGLAAAGLPRRPSEAPFEYAGRVLESALDPAGQVTPRALGLSPAHRLTGLFERAKFSHHDIGDRDRAEAIAALRAVRQELAEAAEPAAREEAAARARAGGDPVGGEPVGAEPVGGNGDGR